MEIRIPFWGWLVDVVASTVASQQVCSGFDSHSGLSVWSSHGLPVGSLQVQRYVNEVNCQL